MLDIHLAVSQALGHVSDTCTAVGHQKHAHLCLCWPVNFYFSIVLCSIDYKINLNKNYVYSVLQVHYVLQNAKRKK